VTFTGPYRTVEELGRIYVYLMDGNVPICYWFGKAKDFMELNPEKYIWIALNPDLAIGKVKEAHMAGMISLKMSIRRKDTMIHDFKKQGSIWRKNPPKRLSSWKIRCFIF